MLEELLRLESLGQWCTEEGQDVRSVNEGKSPAELQHAMPRSHHKRQMWSHRRSDWF